MNAATALALLLAACLFLAPAKLWRSRPFRLGFGLLLVVMLGLGL